MSAQDENKPMNKASKASVNTKTPSKVSSLETMQKSPPNSPKKLTESGLNRLASKLNERRKVYIDVQGEQFEIEITENFRETSVQKIYVEYIKVLYDLRQMENIDDETLLGANHLFNTLVLREFTNLPIPKVNDDIGKLIKLTTNLIDLGIVEALLGKDSPFKKESLDLLEKTMKNLDSNVGKVLSELGLMAELNAAEEQRIDIDDYFAELEAREFEIAEDEDVGLLRQVIDQMNAEGTYEEYMGKLTLEELNKLDERLKLLEESSDEVNEEV